MSSSTTIPCSDTSHAGLPYGIELLARRACNLPKVVQQRTVAHGTRKMYAYHQPGARVAAIAALHDQATAEFCKSAKHREALMARQRAKEEQEKKAAKGKSVVPAAGVSDISDTTKKDDEKEAVVSGANGESESEMFLAFSFGSPVFSVMSKTEKGTKTSDEGATSTAPNSGSDVPAKRNTKAVVAGGKSRDAKDEMGEWDVLGDGFDDEEEDWILT